MQKLLTGEWLVDSEYWVPDVRKSKSQTKKNKELNL